LLCAFVALVFDSTLNDVLSGYRVFSRRFIKSFPVLSGGFEIETELTIHALQLGLAIDEIPTPYSARPTGSVSKLNTWRDGFRILLTIFNLYRAERPLAFYTGVGAAAAVASIALAIPIVVTYLVTGSSAEAAHRRARDWAHAVGAFVHGRGSRPRHGDAWPPRNEAAGLSFTSCARSGKPAGLSCVV
jgi:hypothetical protein